MPQQQQQSGMPAFNWLGLLAGGRGYAGQYFALKDRVAAEEALRQQHFQQQGAAAQGLLASPQYQQFLKNPTDRNAAFQLWGATQGGPAADIGNNILSQAGQAAYGREATIFSDELQRKQQEAQNAFSRSQLLYGHQLQEEATTFSTNESLRADQIRREREIAAQQAVIQSLPAQLQLNKQFDVAFGEGQRGQNDVVPTADGVMLRPMLNSPEGQKIMTLGQAQSGIYDVLDRMETMLSDPRQMDVQEWNALATYAGPKVKDMLVLGTYDAGTEKLINNLIPSMPPSSVRGNPDLLGYTREKLRRGKQFMQQDMQNLSDRSLYPISAFRKNRLYDPSRLPPPPKDSPLEVIRKSGKEIEDLRTQQVLKGRQKLLEQSGSAGTPRPVLKTVGAP